jgi:glutamate-1-semialdehyde 2,1-aminomutase
MQGKSIKTDKSQELFLHAKKRLIGGVNSPVRAFGAVGGSPIFIATANGSVLEDVDGNKYTDFVSSWGPMILGHNNPLVTKAITEQVIRGTSYGAPHAAEITLAELIHQRMPTMEKLRMVNSGTEATMSAIRLARGFTGRDKIIKFSGCYHGHADAFLIEAGSGALTMGHPSSPGVPQDTSKHTLIAKYNDHNEVAALFAKHSKEIAAVIVEPIAANMNVIMPRPGFLQQLRDITQQHGALLIFDEIITGFRVHSGGAQALYNIKPDLTALGKIIGGGLPAAAYGGRADIMAHLSPEGSVYQAGTLSGNPLAVHAGCATLTQLTHSVYEDLELKSAKFCNQLLAKAAESNFPLQIVRQGSLIGMYFTKQQLHDNSDLKHINTELYAKFFRHMLNCGNYFAPSAFEACFIATTHTEQQLNKAVADAAYFFKEPEFVV